MTDYHTEILEGAALPAELNVADGMKAPNVLAPEAESPDARVLIRDAQGTGIAHTALWWRDTPTLEDGRVGAVGGFGALDSASAALALNAACDVLRSKSINTAVGPMNGNTWRSYRFVTESDSRPPFFLEPRNPEWFAECWVANGFKLIAKYSSSVMPLDQSASASRRLRERLERKGVTLRALQSARFAEALEAIYAVSLKAFTENFLYTPLEKPAFTAAYAKIQHLMDPELVLLAERDGECCGFVFALPDLEAVQQGRAPALIVKTLAVDRGARCAGLGSVLVDEVHQIAFRKGYREAIHALQYENNTSLKITNRHTGSQFRQYSLYSKAL